MAMKSIIFITLLVVVFVAPQANAQSIVKVNGTVFCSLNGAPLVNATIPTLAFSNATVQLTIPGISTILPTVTTNLLGRFGITLNLSVPTPLTNLQSLASVVVTTPLSACNSTLSPNTFLQSVSPLQLLSNVTVGSIQLGVGTFVPIRL